MRYCMQHHFGEDHYSIPDADTQLDGNLDVDNLCSEVEMLDEMHGSIHPKRGNTRSARRYIEDYWEQKRLRELDKDIFDE